MNNVNEKKLKRTKGIRNNPIHNLYKYIKGICYNVNNRGYLGNNAGLCDEWKNNYESFYNWAIDKWQAEVPLQRFDDNLNFSPDNCFFAKNIYEKKISIIDHPLYNIYHKMKSKCCNENNKFYLKNINICKEWKDSYESFYNWALDKWSDKKCINRINLELDFTPDNCNFVYLKDFNMIRNPEKAKQTCLAKYGVDNVLKLKSVQDKRKATNLEKYGYECATSNPEVRAKTVLTCQERYGTNAPSQNKEIKERMSNACMKKYGTPYFTKGGTKEQNQVTTWLLEQGFEFKSDYKVLEGREIDLYNEDLKFCIEYCGLYWHSFRSVGNDRHKYKFDKCKENGITLFTIFSDEWLLRLTQTKSLILSALNKFEKTIDVKDCRVLELEPIRAKGFLNKNYITHSDIAKDFNIGIYYEGYLESVYSFIKDGNSLILDRFTNSLNCNVIDGFQSVLPLAIKYCKDNNLNSIIGISNNRYPNEDLYIKHGFQFESEIEPDYQYVKLSNPKKRFYKTNIDNTEGYDKIYDCGKKKFILNI